MKNRNKFPYQCCTHYSKKGYDDGYVMLPIFRFLPEMIQPVTITSSK